MKRALVGALCAVFLLTACACAHYVVAGGQITPLRTENIPFDLDTARQMIEKGDKLIADLESKDTVSRQEYDQFIRDITAIYGDNTSPAGINWELTFFDNREVENSKLDTLRVNKDIFWPTIFHKDFAVNSAQIVNTYYQDASLNRSTLSIMEAYVGDNPKLKGWSRGYEYVKDSKGVWTFSRFGSGESVNFFLANKGLTTEDVKLK